MKADILQIVCSSIRRWGAGTAQAAGWTAGVPFPAGARGFSLHSEAHLALDPMGNGGFFLGGKAAGA
jgi:hypothetical protein